MPFSFSDLPAHITARFATRETSLAKIRELLVPGADRRAVLRALDGLIRSGAITLADYQALERHLQEPAGGSSNLMRDMIAEGLNDETTNPYGPGRNRFSSFLERDTRAQQTARNASGFTPPPPPQRAPFQTDKLFGEYSSPAYREVNAYRDYEEQLRAAERAAGTFDTARAEARWRETLARHPEFPVMRSREDQPPRAMGMQSVFPPPSSAQTPPPSPGARRALELSGPRASTGDYGRIDELYPTAGQIGHWEFGAGPHGSFFTSQTTQDVRAGDDEAQRLRENRDETAEYPDRLMERLQRRKEQLLDLQTRYLNASNSAVARVIGAQLDAATTGYENLRARVLAHPAIADLPSLQKPDLAVQHYGTFLQNYLNIKHAAGAVRERRAIYPTSAPLTEQPIFDRYAANPYSRSTFPAGERGDDLWAKSNAAQVQRLEEQRQADMLREVGAGMDPLHTLAVYGNEAQQRLLRDRASAGTLLPLIEALTKGLPIPEGYADGEIAQVLQQLQRAYRPRFQGGESHSTVTSDESRNNMRTSFSRYEDGDGSEGEGAETGVFGGVQQARRGDDAVGTELRARYLETLNTLAVQT
ncbi:MAG TPA: hypothetical protein VFP52_12295, partial [Myxococcales bacterium]|nr:hypothetical protein [Myxococcales bacterium]